MARDWESEFSDITKDVELNPEMRDQEPLGIFEVNQTIFSLNEASIYLSQFITQSLLDSNLEFPESLRITMRVLDAASAQLVETLSETLENECQCDECIAEQEEEDDEE